MNLGLPELLVILLFAFLIVGPEKLPQLGKTIGKAIGQFRDAQDKVNETLKKEGLDTESLQQAAQNPFTALTKVEEIANRASSFGGGEPAQNDAPGDSAAGGEPASGQAPDEEAGGPHREPGAAKPSGQEAGHKVLSLSDKETFAERKKRLQVQADLQKGSAASEDPAPVASESPAEPEQAGGGEDAQA